MAGRSLYRLSEQTLVLIECFFFLCGCLYLLVVLDFVWLCGLGCLAFCGFYIYLLFLGGFLCDDDM